MPSNKRTSNSPIKQADHNVMGTVSRDLLEMSDQDLGKLVRSYIEDSEHGNWEGFEPVEERAIYALFTDMVIYRDHSLGS